MSPQTLVMLQPIERQDVFQNVLASLEAFISNPSCKPGDRLPPERELAGRLGVSRTLVRQALKLLEASGRVTSRMGSGTYLADPSRSPNPCLLSHTVPNDVDAGYINRLAELRSAVEERIFTCFCETRTDSQLAALARLLDENTAENGPGDELLCLDVSFEEKVGEFVGNEVLYCVQKQLHQAWIMAWTRYGYLPGSLDVLREEHLGLLHAVKIGDRQDVARRIHEHVNRLDEELI